MPDTASTQISPIVGVFVDGDPRFEYHSNNNPVAGTAQYRGPAIGIYEQRMDDDTIRIGTFVASAGMTLNFDLFNSANNGNTVDRSMMVTDAYVRNFQENGESLGAWSVRLDSTTGISYSGTDVSIHGNPLLARDGTTYGGTGDWDADLMGSNVSSSSLVGTFEVQGPDDDRSKAGYLGLVGAFGACHASGGNTGC